MPPTPPELETLTARYHEYGYAIIENAVPDDYLNALRDAVDRLSDQKGTDRNLLAADPTFENLIDGHAGMPLLERLIGDDIQLLSMDLRTCPPGGGNMAWHADHPHWTPTVNTINTALYLDDLTAHNGALRVVPGSHKGPFTLAKDDGFALIPGEVTVQCKAGTMVVFSDALWHRTGQNETDRPRRGVFTYYGHFWHKPCAYADSPQPFHAMRPYIEGKGPRRAQLLGLFREGSEYNHYE